ncbi:MAG: lytic murein transglycosylase, partial [Mariprofundus sp.]
MRFPVSIIAVLLLCAPVTQVAVADDASQKLVQQRIWFQQARVALNKHNMERFDHLKSKLEDYPLTPYLDIWHARISMQQGADARVEKTLAMYADVPESRSLRRAWINELAKRKKWAQISSIFAQHP